MQGTRPHPLPGLCRPSYSFEREGSGQGKSLKHATPKYATLTCCFCFLFGCAWFQLQHVRSLIFLEVCGILFSDQGLNSGSLHWQLGVLAIGPLGKFSDQTFLVLHSILLLLKERVGLFVGLSPRGQSLALSRSTCTSHSPLRDRTYFFYLTESKLACDLLLTNRIWRT